MNVLSLARRLLRRLVAVVVFVICEAALDDGERRWMTGGGDDWR